MYQPNPPPNQNYQYGYNPYNPNEPNQNNNNPYTQAAAFSRGAIPNQGRDSNKLEEGEFYGGDTDLEMQARNGFIRKVYTLVTIQLLITAGIGALGFNSPGFKQTFGSPAVIIIVTILLIVVTIIISCCTEFFRRHAIPLFLLFTGLMSLLVAISITAYKSEAILAAVVITLVLVCGLTAYACCTKRDFTGIGPYLWVFGLVLACFGFGLIFWKNGTAQLVYACAGALLFSIYIIFDTQLIVGKGQNKFSMDDAYIAAINLYLDIINLFLFILQIIGGRR